METTIYFCLSSDGVIYCLGRHGNYEQADTTAENLKLDAIWIFDAQTAKNWTETISYHLRLITNQQGI